MGSLLNNSCDFVPAHNLYRSCHIFSKYVNYSGNYKWDFSGALKQEVPNSFRKLVQEYLKPILESKNEYRGWKLTETTLIYPWIYDLFPDAFYIFWSRHPFDSILGSHLTDDLNDFSVDNNQKTHKFFRIYNEIPTVILIVVIFVVIFKPL